MQISFRLQDAGSVFVALAQLCLRLPELGCMFLNFLNGRHRIIYALRACPEDGLIQPDGLMLAGTRRLRKLHLLKLEVFREGTWDSQPGFLRLEEGVAMHGLIA